jgi:15-cis-phytoene synthase
VSLSHSRRLMIPLDHEAPPGEASALLATLRHLADQHEITESRACTSSSPLTLDEAYQHCDKITRTHSRSFFLSTQLLPPKKRRAIRALYAFCRTSDDLVDNAQQDAVRSLARWVALVHAPQAPPDHPVLLAWNDTAAHYAIPQSLIDELLAGVAMDLTVSRYATFEELWLYCYRVASVVGLISMQIIGYGEGAARYAVRLGVALQLTNILRDVGEDAARGRVYLPQEDLAWFGISADDILHCRLDERFRQLMRFEIARANLLYEQSWPGIALLSADSRLAVGAAAEIYRGILAKIAVNGYDVFNCRARVPLPEKLTTLLWVRWRLRTQAREDRTS